MGWITISNTKANAIDRPSFGATVIANQSKYALTELEQANKENSGVK